MNGKNIRQAGAAHPLVLVTTAFVLGIAATTAAWFAWHLHQAPPQVAIQTENSQPALSEATKSVLHKLNTPVSVRYFAVLDPNGDAAALQDFASRIGELLQVYQQEANGRLSVTQSTGQAYATANKALAEGLTAFNQANGGACFLGIVVEQGGRKEIMPKLEPEWESSLESDLTRAIARLNAAQGPAAASTTNVSEVALIEEVHQIVPNLDTITKEEAVRTLRAASLEEYKRTLAALSGQVQAAEAQLKQALASGSEAEQKAAQEKLQLLQAQPADRLKEIGIRCQEQIEVLDKLKR